MGNEKNQRAGYGPCDSDDPRNCTFQTEHGHGGVDPVESRHDQHQDACCPCANGNIMKCHGDYSCQHHPVYRVLVREATPASDASAGSRKPWSTKVVNPCPPTCECNKPGGMHTHTQPHCPHAVHYATRQDGPRPPAGFDPALFHGDPDFLDITQAELQLYSDKNDDYAGGGADPNGNFNRVAAILDLYPGLSLGDPRVIALTYALKQVDQIAFSLSRGREGKIEGLDERCADAHVYFKIMRILHKRKMEAEHNG